MNLGFHNIYPKCNGNAMFQADNADIGDDLFYSTAYLARKLKAMGHTVATLDTAPLESFDAIVFCDYPNLISNIANFLKFGLKNFFFLQRLKWRGKKPLYLIIIESDAVWPANWRRVNHAPFKKIFTWSPDLADGKKYIHLNAAFKLPEFAPYEPSQAEKFCCLIASQKYSSAPEELYSERVRAVRWFESNHPDEFDLFGQRWDRFYFEGGFSWANRILDQAYGRLPWLPRRRAFPSWRGSIKSKRDVLPKYKFCIAYENASYRGWFTEKMLDPMFAGCVPVYLGNPEVTNIVPREAFIDKRDFRDYDSLYKFLKGMSQAEHENYRQAIHKFIYSKAIQAFGAQAFVDVVLREIINPSQP